MKKKLTVALHLIDLEYRQLLETHLKHTQAMGLQERNKYSVANITKVQRGERGNLHVHYASGDWWHYIPNREWY